jgi:hypothetical protein
VDPILSTHNCSSNENPSARDTSPPDALEAAAVVAALRLAYGPTHALTRLAALMVAHRVALSERVDRLEATLDAVARRTTYLEEWLRVDGFRPRRPLSGIPAAPGEAAASLPPADDADAILAGGEPDGPTPDWCPLCAGTGRGAEEGDFLPAAVPPCPGCDGTGYATPPVRASADDDEPAGGGHRGPGEYQDPERWDHMS